MPFVRVPFHGKYGTMDIRLYQSAILGMKFFRQEELRNHHMYELFLVIDGIMGVVFQKVARNYGPNFLLKMAFLAHFPPSPPPKLLVFIYFVLHLHTIRDLIVLNAPIYFFATSQSQLIAPE